MYTGTLLSVLLSISGIVLMGVFIVVGIKLINILDKVDRIADNLEEKVSSFDNAFSVLSKAVNGVANISNTMAFSVSSALSKIFNKKIKKEEDIYE